MRTIVAGSRGLKDYGLVESAMARIHWKPSLIISGHANGIDSLGERWAKEHGVPLELYPALWHKWGRSAGYKRNEIMAKRAQALVALWDGSSLGTKHMLDIAERYKLVIWKENYGSPSAQKDSHV